MPQTSSVCSRASVWKGQLARVTPPSSARGSKPCPRAPAARRPPRRPRRRRVPRPSSRPALEGPPVEGRPGRLTRRLRLGQRRGQQAPGQVVVPLGQGHRDRRTRPAGRASPGDRRRVRCGPVRRSKHDVEQALVDQPVQVEGGGRARHGDRRGRLVPAHRLRTGAPRARRAAVGVGSASAATAATCAVAVVVHGRSLEPIRVVERVSGATVTPHRRTSSRITLVLVIRRSPGPRPS